MVKDGWKQGVWLRRRARLYTRILLLGLAGLVGILGASFVRGLTDSSPADTANSAQPGDRLSPEARLARLAAIAKKRQARFTMTAVGDIVMGTPERGLPPNDGAALFDAVESQLTGAVVLGNLEGPLTERTESSKCADPEADETLPDEETPGGQSPPPPPPQCFAFRTPPGYAVNLTLAGFTMMNLANNHALDYGSEGLQDTIDVLRANGVSHTGPKDKFTRVPVGELKVAFIGFSPYSFSNSLLDLDEVRAAVKRGNRASDITVVTMHAGAEGPGAERTPEGEETYLGENRGDSRAFAMAAIDAGADLVVGHGPHVLRGMEIYKNRLIAYSLGNYLGYRSLQTAGALGVGAALTVTTDGTGRFVGGRIKPVQLDEDGVPRPGGDAVSRVRMLSRQDFGQRAVKVASNGQVTAN